MAPLIDFQTAVTILQNAGIEVPSEVTDINGLKAWLESEEASLNDQVMPLMRKLRVVRAIRGLVE